MNRPAKTAADRIITRIRKQKAARKTAAIRALESAHQVAHGGWQGAVEGVMQLAGDTAEEQTFNVVQLETFMEAWLVFCRIYGESYDDLRGAR